MTNDILTLVGAVASVIGAIISWMYSKKAKEYSQQAKEHVVLHRKTSDLALMDDKGRIARDAIAKYSPGCIIRGLSAKTKTNAVTAIQEFFKEIRSAQSGVQNLGNIKLLVKEAEASLDGFSQSKNDEEGRTIGLSLYLQICDIFSMVHSAYNASRESVKLRN